MLSSGCSTRTTPGLRFIATVSLRFDTPRYVGEVPDGIRFDFPVHGAVEGPELNGTFPPCAAYLLIDADGVGTINVRAPLLLKDEAVAELEATGRYDFGTKGYERAKAGDLPNSALGWCPRFLTGHPRYLWLNRALCLGVGELRPRETRVDYDLFLISFATSASNSSSIPPSSRRESLCDRLGGRSGIYRLMDGFIDALHGNEQLNQQNPRIALAQTSVNPVDLKNKVTDFVCRLTGGNCEYRGRSMKTAHSSLLITDSDWELGVIELLRVLNKFGVPQLDQDELLTKIRTTRHDIVTRA